MGELTDSLDPVSRIPRGFNPVDLETGRSGSPYDLGDGSIWQKRPEILSRAKKLWPITKEQDIILENVAERQARIIQELRKKWMTQAPPDRIVRPKWKQSKRNLRMEETGRKKYDNNTSTPRWRMAQDQEEEVDDDGRVRTIITSFRPRQVTDKSKTLKIGVQRSTVLLTKEEQGTPVQDDGQMATST